MAEPVDLSALPLRERKRLMTRRAILAAADRLFEERGFADVTVAQIADAANVSVKTVFVYFRSKEDLAFTDTSLLEACVAAVERRPARVSPGQAVARVLAARLETDGQPAAEGIEGFHRGYGDSPALRSRLLRMWAEYEDRFTVTLAAEAGTAPTPAMRLTAITLVALLRTLTAPEMRAAVAALPPARAQAYVRDWLLTAAQSTS
jgi:AcrR family transcriptional regulator